MITTKDKLKLQLLKYSETERLERHADLEVAYAIEKDTVAKLQDTLKRKEEECAGLRHDIKKLEGNNA